MKILVTGASGLIGQAVVGALNGGAFLVAGLDNSEQSVSVPGPVRFYKADLTTAAGKDALVDFGPDQIVHCAALLPNVSAGIDAARAAEVNRRIDAAIVDHCSDRGVRLIYMSGASVYGDRDEPWDETSAVHPANAYMEEKAATEKDIQRGLTSYLIFRVSSPYGPRMRSRTVLRIFVENAFHGRDLIYLGEGGRIQNFVYTRDVAEAVVLAASRPDAAGIFNIASGEPISMRDLARLVVSLIPETRSRVLAAGKPDPQEHYRGLFGIEKAKAGLGWSPRVTLTQGLRELFDHLKTSP